MIYYQSKQVFNMFVINICHHGKKVSSAFMTQLQDVQKFALDWSKYKNTFLNEKIKFGEFYINVYDVRNPIQSDYVDKPTYIYY